MASAHAIIGLIFPIIAIIVRFWVAFWLNFRAADHHTIFLMDKANIRNARDAYFYCIRAETVSIRALLFELLAAVAPGGWWGGVAS
jgi:hypothetical protein